MKRFSYKPLMYLLVLLFTLVSLQAEENATTPSDAIRIMPLGDSITYDNREADLHDPRPASTRTGYRSHLWYMLQDAKYGADFVGSRVAGQAIKPPFDPDNEGHPGWTSLDIAEKTYDYMVHSQPDIVLLHIGTNDHGTFAGDVDRILNEINYYEQASGKKVHVIVAQIIDRRDHDRLIPLFNDNVKKVVASHVMAGDFVTMVDMYHDAHLTRGDYADNTHPNDQGYYKMATVWFNALMTPYNQALNAFPYSLVPSAELIESISINDTATSVTITTKVPESGILF